MAIALVTHALGTAAYSTSVASFDSTGANLLVVIGAAVSGVPTIADNKGNTWIALTTRVAGSLDARMWYAKSPIVGSGHTITVSSPTFVRCCAAAFSGAHATAPLDQDAGAATQTTAISATITPSAGGQLVVGVSANNDGSGASCNILSLLDQVPFIGGSSEGVALAYEIQAAPTARTITWQASGASDYWACELVSFQPAVAWVPPTAATPTFNNGAGTYPGSVTVTFSSTSPGVTFRYTTDGSTPTSSAGTIGSSVTLTTSCTLKVMCYLTGTYTDSGVATAAYTIAKGGNQAAICG
jgi:hypothetical protein